MLKLINLDDNDTVCTIERLVDTEEVEQEVNALAETGNELQNVIVDIAPQNSNGASGKNGNGRK